MPGIETLNPACKCNGDSHPPTMQFDCVCGTEERALRAFIRGELPPMTPEQREWCYNEIDSVEAHDRKDYEQGTDAELARGVLNGWQDYCRDKGLL